MTGEGRKPTVQCAALLSRKPTFTDFDQQHALLRFTVLTHLIFVDVEQKLSGKEIHPGLNCKCPE
jgi:hypothetical protein